MYSKIKDLEITVDSSVKHITPSACMYLSEAIENGVMLTENPAANIVIYDDRIDFGMCMNPALAMMSESMFPDFYMEGDRMVYRFSGNAHCEVADDTIDYTGATVSASAGYNPLLGKIYPQFA